MRAPRQINQALPPTALIRATVTRALARHLEAERARRTIATWRRRRESTITLALAMRRRGVSRGRETKLLRGRPWSEPLALSISKDIMGLPVAIRSLLYSPTHIGER